MKLWSWWKAYWFRPVPLFNLAICRIGIVGFQLFWLLVERDFLDISKHLLKLPPQLYRPFPILHLLIWPIGWRYEPSFAVLEIICWVTIISGFFGLVGFMTTPSLMIFAVGNVFMQAFVYAFGEMHHPEAIMMIALTVLALSPAGGVLSVDDVRHRLSRSLRERRFDKYSILNDTSVFALWPILLLQWIFSLVYFSAAMEKLLYSGLDWMNGYTLQYFLVRDGLRWDSSLGIWLGQHHFLVLVLSIFTIVWEAIFFLVLIIPSLAYVFVPLGIAFHTGIYLTMRAPFFQWYSVYTVFFPWDRMVRSLSRRIGWLRTPEKTEVLYDGQCPLCLRSMTLLSYFDWFGRLTYTDVVQHWPELAKRYPDIPREEYLREMFVLGRDGALRRGFFAFREIFRQLPLLWPVLVLFYLPMASNIGPRIYGMVASRRKRFEHCNFDTCTVHEHRADKVITPRLGPEEPKTGP